VIPKSSKAPGIADEQPQPGTLLAFIALGRLRQLRGTQLFYIPQVESRRHAYIHIHIVVADESAGKPSWTGLLPRHIPNVFRALRHASEIVRIGASRRASIPS